MLVGDGCFLLLGFAQVQYAAQASAIEQRQAELRADTERARAPGAEIAEFHGLRTDVARQGNPWIEIAFGHTDARGRRMQAGFGLADVRAAFGQLRR